MGRSLFNFLIDKKDELYDLHHVKNFSLTDIAFIFNCSRCTMAKYFKILGIEIRDTKFILKHQPNTELNKHLRISCLGKFKGKQGVFYSCLSCSKELFVDKYRIYRTPISGKCRSCVNKREEYWNTYNQFIHACKRREIENKISFEEFLEFVKVKSCFYCNADIYWNKYREKQDQSMSRYNLDRKNSSLGYTVNNTVVCCSNCNTRKGNFYSFNEFIQIVNILKTTRTELKNLWEYKELR